jgi:SAM-dependent methyltransferase
MEFEFYDHDYYDGTGKSNYDTYTRDSSPFAVHADLIERVMAYFGLAGPVLDVGCAKGFLVEELRSRGVEAYGVDWSQYAVDAANPSVSPYLRQASALDLPFADQSFDMVVSFDVFEHLDLPSARKAMVECARVSRRQLHQINTGRLEEWRYDGDTSHCTQLPLEEWSAVAANEGLTRVIVCEPDGWLPFLHGPRRVADTSRVR